VAGIWITSALALGNTGEQWAIPIRRPASPTPWRRGEPLVQDRWISWPILNGNRCRGCGVEKSGPPTQACCLRKPAMVGVHLFRAGKLASLRRAWPPGATLISICRPLRRVGQGSHRSAGWAICLIAEQAVSPLRSPRIGRSGGRRAPYPTCIHMPTRRAEAAEFLTPSLTVCSLRRFSVIWRSARTHLGLRAKGAKGSLAPVQSGCRLLSTLSLSERQGFGRQLQIQQVAQAVDRAVLERVRRRVWRVVRLSQGLQHGGMQGLGHSGLLRWNSPAGAWYWDEAHELQLAAVFKLRVRPCMEGPAVSLARIGQCSETATRLVRPLEGQADQDRPHDADGLEDLGAV